jgi:hypothetical protein
MSDNKIIFTETSLPPHTPKVQLTLEFKQLIIETLQSDEGFRRDVIKALGFTPATPDNIYQACYILPIESEAT